MSKFIEFGDARRFQIALRWRSDTEPRTTRPARFGWSVGDVKIVISDQIITQSRKGDYVQAHVGWYIGPLAQWITENWVRLLHEEDFSWPEKSSAPAVVASRRSLERWIASRDDGGREQYRRVQDWYRRHALRCVSEGGLFPDLFIRRFIDDIELSWTSDPPSFAPPGFVFVAEPGTVRLPVEDVAEPLLGALRWLAQNPPPEMDEADQNEWRALGSRIGALASLKGDEMATAYAPAEVLRVASSYFNVRGRAMLIDQDASPERPYVRTFSPAVAMFGGVNPSLGDSDVEWLCSMLAGQYGLTESDGLAALAGERSGLPLGVPHEDGRAFAEELLAELSLPADQDRIDVYSIASGLGIRIEEHTFDTDTIRGVALAGHDFGPAIVVNTNSIYNENARGRRFTVAHEFCHILHDRARARRVTHVSGPWVAPGIERRANAFAAYFLMPRGILLRHLNGVEKVEEETVRSMAAALDVNESALIEHLYNYDLIEEQHRARLRQRFRG